MKHLFTAFVAAALLASCAADGDKPQPLTMVIGTYTSSGSAGLYSLRFDTASGEAVLLDSCRMVHPSFLTFSADGSRIYAVSERERGAGAAAAIAFDSGTGAFRMIGTQPTDGDSPCYISTNGHAVVTANYGGGSMSVFPTDSEGGLESVAAVFSGAAGGPDPWRQQEPHVHCAVFSPDGRHLYASDFSADRFLCFDVDGERISPALLPDGSQQSVPVESGCGPRHLIFDAAGTHAYAIGELSGSVTVFDYADGALRAKQVVDADPHDGRGSADIHLGPDGRFLYASNRLRGDGIAVFAVDGTTGMLTEAGYVTTGPHPRNFNITPDGKWLLCACRDSDAVEIYRIDSESGMPVFTGRTIAIRMPVCVQFADRIN